MTCKMLWKKCFPKICCRMLRMKTCLLLVLLSKREEVTNFHHLCSERLNNKTRVCTHFLIVLIENWNSSESHVKEIGPWDPTTLCPCKYLQLARRTFNRISEDSFLSLRHTQVSAKIFFPLQNSIWDFFSEDWHIQTVYGLCPLLPSLWK